MNTLGQCFILVLARRDAGQQADLATHTRSIGQYRVAAMAAADHVVQLYRTRRKDLRITVIDAEAVTSPQAYSLQSLRAQLDADSWWLSVRGRFSRTLDFDKLSKQVRSATAGFIKATEPLVIVVNQELTPPPEWRYLLWDTKELTSVISANQMDPSYLSVGQENRFDVIERRLRAAMFCSVGESLGLSRCDNDACYMRRDVLSVTDLDAMNSYGAEHDGEGP